MVINARLLLLLAVVVLAGLVGAVMLFPNHRAAERLMARQSADAPAATLRQCLASRLGLSWEGDPHAMHASAWGLRVVVSDNGKSRQIGMFTAAGRKLSDSETAALHDCAASK